jgi:hypothetical protein
MKHFALLLFFVVTAHAYPLDGYERTKIRRLKGYRMAVDKKLPNSLRIPPGGLWGMDRVALRLKGSSIDISADSAKDSFLQDGIEKIFVGRNRTYGLALLDITDPAKPAFALVRPDIKFIPGSVGKILVGAGYLNALAETYPNDYAARERILRETIVTADEFIIRDSKTVPLFEESPPKLWNRPLQLGDKFSAWEWLDHMFSQSSNAAGAVMWKEAMLLKRFGKKYPLPEAEAKAFLRDTPKTELRDLALATLEEPLKRAGIDTNNLRLGTMFTSRAGAVVPGTSSYATPVELLRLLLKIEQGKIVDEWSSLELKRLMYFARSRYRYASAPSLSDAGVFFKSGSLFQCAPEAGFTCGQYRGNKTNIMNSVAIVESAGKVYLVALMSNVLKINSASEHQAIAGQVEKLIQSRPR